MNGRTLQARAGRGLTNSAEDDELVALVFGRAEPDTTAKRKRFEEACEMAWKGWQVLGSTAPRLLQWGKKQQASATAKRLSNRSTGVELYAGIQDRLCRRIVAEFRDRSIPYVLLKGSALRYTVYEHPGLRCGFDLDFGVPSAHIREAEKVARKFGYFPAQWDADNSRFVIADPALRANVEQNHYELGFLVRYHVVQGLPQPLLSSFDEEDPNFRVWHRTETGDAGCYCAVDLHHAISHDIPLEPFLTSSVEQGGVRVPTYDLQLFHLIFKLYWEGVHNYGKGLYQFMDLVNLMRFTDEETFAKCREWLSKFHLEAAGYYVLRRLDLLLDKPVPAYVQAFVTEMANPRPGTRPFLENDMGDVWLKLQGKR